MTTPSDLKNSLASLAKTLTEMSKEVDAETAEQVFTASANQSFQTSGKPIDHEGLIVGQVDENPDVIIQKIISDLEKQRSQTEYLHKKAFHTGRKYFVIFLVTLGTFALFTFLTNSSFDSDGFLCRKFHERSAPSPHEHPLAKINRAADAHIKCPSSTLASPPASFYWTLWGAWMALYLATEVALSIYARTTLKFRSEFPPLAKISLVGVVAFLLIAYLF